MDSLGSFAIRRSADGPYGSFPNQWERIFKGSELKASCACPSPQLRSLANDLSFTEVTVAALLGHSHKTITARYIHWRNGARHGGGHDFRLNQRALRDAEMRALAMLSIEVHGAPPWIGGWSQQMTRRYPPRR